MPDRAPPCEPLRDGGVYPRCPGVSLGSETKDHCSNWAAHRKMQSRAWWGSSRSRFMAHVMRPPPPSLNRSPAVCSEVFADEDRSALDQEDTGPTKVTSPRFVNVRGDLYALWNASCFPFSTDETDRLLGWLQDAIDAKDQGMHTGHRCKGPRYRH